MKKSLVLAAFALATAGLAAQSQPQTKTREDAAPKPNQVINVSGCLAAGANNTYTLTAQTKSGRNPGEPVTGTTATTPTGTKVAKTVQYVLTPVEGVDLKSEVGHMVKVTGREAPAQASATQKQSSSGAAANAKGTTGTSGTPTVKTTEQAQIVARQLTVSAVKKLANKCDLVK